MSRVFTSASDLTLLELIRGAKARLVIVAPGLSIQVASAIAKRISDDGGPPVLALIVDVDPEVCRLGYGEIQAIEILRSALQTRDLSLQTQPGVRIGLVVADDDILVFSPTPKLIEEGSKSEKAPNAIRITPAAAIDIARACGAGVEAAVIESQELGLDLLDESKLERVKQNLTEVPPRRFDLARLERIFNYKLEFVEFSLDQYKLNTRSVPLPPELLGLADEGLKNRVRNSFRVFEAGSPFSFTLSDPDSVNKTLEVNEKWLSAEADRLRKEFFIPLGSKSYGNLILKRLKPAFEKQVTRLKALVDAYAIKVSESITAAIRDTRDDLVKALHPRVRAAPPASWLRRSVDGSLDDPTLLARLEAEVDHAFAKVQQSFKPTLACVFKGVTYETICGDQHFQERMIAHFGKEEAAKLLSEHDASRASDLPSS
jgi:hypothetical protein